ncbi:sulfurtransferase TusA family protein [Leptothoe kymatousa]|uniref:Sulfurtransferase TusA family protein n=1 Tax=Leptothoe kymatousa TAU-MAC 1615 TaxID=2364775 RepID=A0ABS5Y4Y0_9CYAN|nr:sulfurtransferase TusA family protein [Leptothoe kymatousa]MBT9312900.1 sulfurtransferase TusA family protein [Leptothoe kymatousa TAU-MAC 1615]
MMDALSSPDETLDLRGTPCPLNFVRTKLKLQKMAVGALLEIWLDAGEPIEQVPDSLRSSGFLVEKLEETTEGYFMLHVRQPVG